MSLDEFEEALLAKHKAPWVYAVGMAFALTSWFWIPLGIAYACWRFTRDS